MEDHPRSRQFGSSKELLQYLREHTDDIENVVIPVQEKVAVRGPEGQRGVMTDPGALLRLCSGESLVISREDAAMLINDGVLQRLKIKCVLDPLKK